MISPVKEGMRLDSPPPVFVKKADPLPVEGSPDVHPYGSGPGAILDLSSDAKHFDIGNNLSVTVAYDYKLKPIEQMKIGQKPGSV